MTTIPKIIHQIWIGNRPRPKSLMDTCRDINPTWEYRLWTEENLPTDFINQHHIDAMRRHQSRYPEAGMADIIRYELLYRFGGFYIDADTEFLNPLDDFLTENDSFCCYESEVNRGDLLANCYLAATMGNELMRLLIRDLNEKPSVVEGLPWQETGPLFLTRTVKKYHYDNLTIYPSHYFIPRHFTSAEVYDGPDKVYCTQKWYSTLAGDPEPYLQAVELNKKGEKLFQIGRMEAAKACFKESIQVFDQFAEPYNNLAVISWQQDLQQDAIDYVAEALRIDPGNPDALANLKQMAQALGA